MERPAVLITSASKKIPLIRAIHHALKKIGGGFIVGGDQNPKVLASYFVDRFWKMPSIDQLQVEEVIELCKKENVFAIIPTRDGELSFFSRYRDALKKEGIHVMVSDFETIELCQDKFRFYQTVKKMGYPIVPTSLQCDSLLAQGFVVKERYGSGSSKQCLNVSMEQAKTFSKSLQDPIFQPFVSGEETSIDLYVASDGKTHGVVCRTRELIVAGESQVSQVYRDPELEKMVSELAEKIGIRGHALIQVIDGHILECNPRVGGASTLSFSSGLESLYWFFLEGRGEKIPPYEKCSKFQRLVRYPEDWII
jgi:carbamoyl-phosphate synthase large subunit